MSREGMPEVLGPSAVDGQRARWQTTSFASTVYPSDLHCTYEPTHSSKNFEKTLMLFKCSEACQRAGRPLTASTLVIAAETDRQSSTAKMDSEGQET